MFQFDRYSLIRQNFEKKNQLPMKPGNLQCQPLYHDNGWNVCYFSRRLTYAPHHGINRLITGIQDQWNSVNSPKEYLAHLILHIPFFRRGHNGVNSNRFRLHVVQRRISTVYPAPLKPCRNFLPHKAKHFVVNVRLGKLKNSVSGFWVLFCFVFEKQNGLRNKYWKKLTTT